MQAIVPAAPPVHGVAMVLDPFTDPLPPVVGMGFTGNPLDRADRLRHDAPALEAARADPRARVLPLKDLDPLLHDQSGRRDLLWVPAASFAPDAELLLLGLDGEGAPRFAAAWESKPPVRPVNARNAAMALPVPDSGILAQARSMLAWHDSHRHCARCGASTHVEKGGYLRRCSVCNAEHFPRTDPVTIMLVLDGDACLLGRKREFPAGFYSALAGFLEPGETIEDAVRREVEEEAGIRTGQVRYVASQPWPFPSSLMIGCFAQALSREITLDTTELEDARWFSLEDCMAAFEGKGSFGPAPSIAIAHHLLKCWVGMRSA